MADGITVGSAYVQIIPSARGIKGSITNVLDGESYAAGNSAGKNIASSIKKAIGGAITTLGLGKALATALNAGGTFEQLEGGVKKIFGEDAAKTVMENAKNAFSFAGMSANQYMETATGFSASLVNSLGGDTAKAAKLADQAIRDMSDNANTFGTDMESVQAAYQGFAKQNYTMLDNLKLGYGGSASEMARLVKESGVLGEAGKDLTATNLNEKVSFDKIIEAIKVTQDRLSITETTSKEAAGTLEGSFAQMKAAAENMFTSLATGDDVKGNMQILIDSVKTYLVDNLLPMLGEIIGNVPEAIGTVIDTLKPVVIEKIGNIKDEIKEKFNLDDLNFDWMVAGFAGIAAGIIAVKTALSIYSAYQAVVSAIQAAKIALNLAEETSLWGVVAAELATIAPFVLAGAVIATLVAVIIMCVKHWDGIKAKMIEVGGIVKSAVVEKFNELKTGVSNAVEKAVSAVQNFVSGAKTKFTQFKTTVATVFGNIRDKMTEPIKKAKDVIEGVIKTVKKKFEDLKSFKWLKVPSISVSGGSAPWGIGGKGTKPSFSISWNKKAMKNPFMFSDATLFGAGEAGDEILYGRSNLMADIREATGSGATYNITVNVSGAENPEEWGRRFANELERYGRMGIA